MVIPFSLLTLPCKFKKINVEVEWAIESLLV